MAIKVYYKNEEFIYKEALLAGRYDLCNRSDEMVDIFNEECITKEDRADGISCGKWYVKEIMEGGE